MPNKLSQFWQELKRRNVVRVIIVYTGAAFVILSLVDMIREPFELPNWSFKLVLVILFVGLIIAVILSWIYDIHPEGGMVKTKPADKVKAEDLPRSSNSWKIASYISFVVIIGLIVLNIVPRAKGAAEAANLEKSIAVLPFESLSIDPELQYQADGVMDAILLHLSKIKDLRVMSRTSVEQYRDTKKTIPEICNEMGVSYVLEGSFRRYEDQARLIVQLIQSGKEGHVWANQYDRNWGNIFEVESEVAQEVARELKAVITPEEKVRLEKKPTTSLTAYDFYLKGEESLYDWWAMKEGVHLIDSENLFNKALEYDSTYALAYARLAWIQYYKDRQEEPLNDDYLDSALIFADIALSYDNELAEAYDVKGNIFRVLGKVQPAIVELEKAIKYKPNFFEPYWDLGILYGQLEKQDLAIYNLNQATTLHRGTLLPNLLRAIATAYLNSGFDEQAESYVDEAYKLDGDTINFIVSLAVIEGVNGNYVECIKYLMDAYVLDTLRYRAYMFGQIAYNNSFLGHFEESLKYYKKSEIELEVQNLPNENNLHRIGYALWKLGMEKEANDYFDEQIRILNKMNELGRPSSLLLYTYYDLAAISAFRGEKDRAYENLRIFNQKQTIPKWMNTLIKDDPLFDNIRNEPEFQQIVRDVEAKYQAEHERVRQWLEENDML